MNQFECSCGWQGTTDTVAWVPAEEIYKTKSDKDEPVVTVCPSCYNRGKYRRVE